MKKLVLPIGIMAVMMIVLSGCSLMEVPITSRLEVSEPVSRPYVWEPKTIMAEDINLSYLEGGQGPTVILLHGGVIPMNYFQSVFMADSHITAFTFLTVLGIITPLAQSTLHAGAVSAADTWNYNLDTLAKNFHVIALDLPGFGGSDKPRIDYTLDDFALYLDAFLRAKKIEKASLVGHGLGGEIAIYYALQHPEKVERLVLVDSFGAFGPSKRFERHSLLNLPKSVLKYLQREKAAKINIFFPLYSRMLGNWEAPKRQAVYLTLSPQVAYDYQNKSGRLILSREGTSGEFLEAVADYKIAAITSAEMREEVHACHLALMETRRKNLILRLPEIQVPVLIIHGNYDPVVRKEEALLMEAAFPHSQLITYERSAHYPMVEEADRFSRDLTFFLQAPSPMAESSAAP